MAVGVLKAFSVTASSNASADSNINFAEGQSPASLNDSNRALMAAVKGFANQIAAAKTTGGSANAQTLTSDSVAAISTAYAAGMIFCVKAGYTNTTTTPTFNVDGVGAKTIKKGGAQAALAASDIVAGGIYWLAYEASGDCFLLLNPESGSISAQPLDATLTALAALSWSSGNALVQFTAADTVSLTLTPSVNTLTATSTVAATSPLNGKNTTDNASVCLGVYEGDRATMANGDAGYISYKLSDSAGNQDEYARLTITATTVTSTSEVASLAWSLMAAGSLTNKLTLTTAALGPTSNDGLQNGASGAGWSDYFGAPGHTTNLSTDYVETHSAGFVDVTTGAFASSLPLSSETSGTLTSASKNRHIAASGGITLPNSVFAARNWQTIDGNGTARTITRGAGVTMYVNGTDSATATLSANGFMGVVWRSASVCILTGDVV